MSDKKVKLMEELSRAAKHKYQKHAPEIMQRAEKYYEYLCKENPSDSSKILMHTWEKIFPSIAYYKAMLEVTGNKEKSYALVADNFNGHAEDISRTIRLLCKTPFFYKLGPAIMEQILLKAFGEKSGFEMKVHPKKKGRCHIDMTVCPYWSYCVKYGCPELAAAFCNSDDISYGNMHPKLIWGRTKTLSNGNNHCNFILEIKEK